MTFSETPLAYLSYEFPFNPRASIMFDFSLYFTSGLTSYPLGTVAWVVFALIAHELNRVIRAIFPSCAYCAPTVVGEGSAARSLIINLFCRKQTCIS